MKSKAKLESMPGICPKCKKPLDDRITQVHIAGQLRPVWVHRKTCMGGK